MKRPPVVPACRTQFRDGVSLVLRGSGATSALQLDRLELGADAVQRPLRIDAHHTYFEPRPDQTSLEAREIDGEGQRLEKKTLETWALRLLEKETLGEAELDELRRGVAAAQPQPA